jgi:hypothetical protein
MRGLAAVNSKGKFFSIDNDEFKLRKVRKYFLKVKLKAAKARSQPSNSLSSQELDG